MLNSDCSVIKANKIFKSSGFVRELDIGNSSMTFLLTKPAESSRYRYPVLLIACNQHGDLLGMYIIIVTPTSDKIYKISGNVTVTLTRPDEKNVTITFNTSGIWAKGLVIGGFDNI